MKITSSFLHSESDTYDCSLYLLVTFRCSSVSFFPYLPVGPASESQHGGERGSDAYSSESVDQTAESPTSHSSGAGSLLCAHPVCCHVSLLGRAVLRPLLLLWEAKIHNLQSAARLKTKHKQPPSFLPSFMSSSNEIHQEKDRDNI